MQLRFATDGEAHVRTTVIVAKQNDLVDQYHLHTFGTGPQNGVGPHHSQKSVLLETQ